MKKYKYGDKILIKARFLNLIDNDLNLELIGSDSETYEMYISSECIYTPPEMSAEEAWKLMKTIYSLNNNELNEIFNTYSKDYILLNNAPQQIKEKIKKWEAKKINIGDEVVHIISPNDDGCKFFVTYINNENSEISGVSGFTGRTFSSRDMNRYQKTGRHINIDKILKQIGETDA